MRLSTLTRSEMNQTLFAVYLAEVSLAPADLGAVFCVVGGLFVGKHIAKGGIGGKVQSPDFIIDFPDGTELTGAVHVRLDVDRLEPVGELSGLGCPVIFFDMFTGPGDGEKIEELKIVKTQHVHQGAGCALAFIQREPSVKLLLREARGGVDAGDAMVEEGSVLPFGDEGYLVTQVREAVVHGRGGQHQNTGLDAFLDDAPHEAVVTGLPSLPGGPLVAEVM